MGQSSVSGVTASSAAMMFCGLCNVVFNILRRFLHLLSTVREAAKLDTDYTDPSSWKDIAFSVYDIAVIFNLSSGILAAVQIAAAVCGFIYAARRGNHNSSAAVIFFGVLCTVLGIISVVTLYLSHTAGFFLIAVLCVTQIAVPIIFTKTAAQHRGDVREKGAS